MISMLALNVVDRGLEPNIKLNQTIKLVFACFSDKQVVRSKNKDWEARNQDDVLKWSLLTDCCFSELVL
jgi:hypothetical protein